MPRKEYEAVHLSLWFTTTQEDSLMLPNSPGWPRARNHRAHTAPVPSPTQSALPALFPLLFFSAPYIEYSRSFTIWDFSSSSCSRDKGHGYTAETRRIPHIYKASGIRWKPPCCRYAGTTFDSGNAGLIFQLLTEHKHSFSINSGNTILPKCPSNNCTSSSEILSQKTLAQLYPAHRLTIFCSKCRSLL